MVWGGQDGAITEAMVWSPEGSMYNIPTQPVRYALQRHLWPHPSTIKVTTPSTFKVTMLCSRTSGLTPPRYAVQQTPPASLHAAETIYQPSPRYAMQPTPLVYWSPYPLSYPNTTLQGCLLCTVEVLGSATLKYCTGPCDLSQSTVPRLSLLPQQPRVSPAARIRAGHYMAGDAERGGRHCYGGGMSRP